MVGQELLAVGRISAVIVNGLCKCKIIESFDGFAHPDVIHLIAVLAAVAKSVVRVKVTIRRTEDGSGRIAGVVHLGLDAAESVVIAVNGVEITHQNDRIAVDIQG